MKIEVFLDIYPNYFSETNRYCYDNIRAVNPEQQNLVEQCIQEMIQQESKLLAEISIKSVRIFKMPYQGLNHEHTTEPIETNRKAWLNTQTQQFEFNHNEE
ncbi:MAG: hypothetical protein IKI11_03825 [Neisseriaceae bacterium]|nr:hypothetical protein [Neisseriaceae bacterium]